MAIYKTAFGMGQEVWFLDPETVKISWGTIRRVVITCPSVMPGLTHDTNYMIACSTDLEPHAVREEHTFENKASCLSYIKGLGAN